MQILENVMDIMNTMMNHLMEKILGVVVEFKKEANEVLANYSTTIMDRDITFAVMLVFSVNWYTRDTSASR